MNDYTLLFSCGLVMIMLTTFFSLQDENGRIPRGNQTPYPETSTFIGREKVLNLSWYVMQSHPYVNVFWRRYGWQAGGSNICNGRKVEPISHAQQGKVIVEVIIVRVLNDPEINQPSSFQTFRWYDSDKYLWTWECAEPAVFVRSNNPM